ncbi:hypothetical protein EDB89DRAFT_1920780 [Lactarius sanguifluus]|nr:hypothetical protein EDB89DRAFT_1920780 [Lactarius sanguifluus]
MPILESIQECLESAEDYIYVSFSSVKADMPNIQEALNRLWADVSRFGPTIPEIRLPNPWKASGLGVGVVGIGLLVAYRARTQSRFHRKSHTATHERRQVVVVLGGDHPVALPLILALEKKGFIIIASVATPEAVDELERVGNGYVKALVLNPFEPGTIPIFLRSLASTLSHRFPINIHGDPHASPAAHPFIHSVISLFGLVRFSALSPLEHVQLQSEYLKYLNATHITPLQIIQALLPLMRNSPSRARDSIKNGKSKKSIVVCVQATDAHVLRREVRVAAATGGSEGMSDINVVSFEVGALDVPPFAGRHLLDHSSKEYTQSWTPSEKLAYGPAWEIALEAPAHFQRKAQKADVFVDDILQVVSYGRIRSVSFCGLRLNIWSVFDWMRGGRYAVGSGALTSCIVSHLPGALLDIIISIPALSQNRTLAIAPEPELPAPPYTRPSPPEAPADVGKESTDSPQTSSERDGSENGSEADVESNDGAGVGESWISLKPDSTRTSESSEGTAA